MRQFSPLTSFLRLPAAVVSGCTCPPQSLHETVSFFGQCQPSDELEELAEEAEALPLEALCWDDADEEDPAFLGDRFIFALDFLTT